MSDSNARTNVGLVKRGSPLPEGALVLGGIYHTTGGRVLGGNGMTTPDHPCYRAYSTSKEVSVVARGRLAPSYSTTCDGETISDDAPNSSAGTVGNIIASANACTMDTPSLEAPNAPMAASVTLAFGVGTVGFLGFGFRLTVGFAVIQAQQVTYTSSSSGAVSNNGLSVNRLVTRKNNTMCDAVFMSSYYFGRFVQSSTRWVPTPGLIDSGCRFTISGLPSTSSGTITLEALHPYTGAGADAIEDLLWGDY